MLCFYIGFLFPVDTLQLFSWPLLSWFLSFSFICLCHLHFLYSSCTSDAFYQKENKDKDKVAVERFCTRCLYRTFVTEITDIFQVFVKQMTYLLMQNYDKHRGPENMASSYHRAQLLQE